MYIHCAFPNEINNPDVLKWAMFMAPETVCFRQPCVAEALDCLRERILNDHRNVDRIGRNTEKHLSQFQRADKPPYRRSPGIPAESDWGDYNADLDQKWAHDRYIGRSNEEMQHYFRSNPIEAASDLQFMSEVPFRYYMLGYRDFVMSGNFAHLDASDAASCFLGVVTEKLEKQPRYIAPIMPDLLPALEYVASNQAEFDADERIYGNFLKRLKRIQTLYAESKDRYKRYP
jgi:hypothetical protein